MSNTSNTINTRVTGFSNSIYASLSNTSNTIFTNLATTNTNLTNTSNSINQALSNTSNTIFVIASNTSNVAVWSSNNLVRKSGDTMTGGLILTGASPSMTTNGTILLRNGNTTGVFSCNQFQFSWSNTNNFPHAINTRHNSAANDANNAFDFYVWQTSQTSNVVGNKNVLSVTSVGTGIGTTTPTQQLHVVGKVFSDTQIMNSSNDSSNVPGFSWAQNSNTGMYLHSINTVGFTTGGNARMVIDSSGNIGVGTVTPSTRLDVNGTINATTYQGTTITNLSNMALWASNNLLNKAGDTMTGTLNMYANLPMITLSNSSAFADFGMASVAGSFSTNTNAGDIVLRAFTTGRRIFLQTGTGSSAICINSNNTIGINTPTPVEQFHVNGKIYGSNQVLSSASNDASNIPSFSWRENSNTGIYHHATNSFGFSTNGVARAVIDASGNVGIGILNPSYRLDVNGDVNFTGTIRQNGSVFTSGTTSHWINNGSNVYVNLGSNVGIGTSTPAQQLHVSQPTTGSAVIMRVSASNNTLNSDIGVVGAAGNLFNNTLLGDLIIRNTTGCNIHLGYGSTSPTFSITNNGNVGIGTMTPAARLEITPNNTSLPSTNGIYVYNPTTTTTGNSVICARTNTSTGGNPWISLDVNNVAGWGIGIDNADSQKLKITNSWDFSVSTSTRLTIDRTNGNVGIGTSNPSYRMDVNGTLQANGCRIGVQGSVDGTSARGLFLWDTADNNWGIYVATSNASRSLANATTCGFSTVSSHAMRFRSFNGSANGWIFENNSETALVGIRSSDGQTYIAGNLGIGTTTPTEKLHVIGKILASDDITAFSDKRLKSNITPITDGLTKVLQLNGYTFNRKEEDKKRHTGLIAQEVLDVLPEAVHQHEDGYYSVAYGNLAGLFVEAIKSFHHQYETKIKDIETQMQIMHDKVNMLLSS